MQRIERLLNISLISVSFLFITLYSILSFNARLVSDDFYYLYLRNHYGAWDGMMFQYMNWSGRWTAHWIACSLLRFWKSDWFLPLINLATLFGLFLVIRQSLNKIYSAFRFPGGSVMLPGFSFLFVTCFFFATYNIGESWFWYIIVITYLWSLIAFLFIVNFIFEERRFIRWIPAILAGIFIGGASESFALVFLLSLAIIAFIKRKSAQDKKILTKTLIILTVIGISFLISYLAPGTDVRRSLLPQTTLLFKATSYVKSIAKYFIQYLPHHAGYIFIFSFPWVLLGALLKERFDSMRLNHVLKKGTLLFICSLAVLFVPTTYIMSEAGPDRAMLLISFITAVYAAFLAVVAGTILKKMKNFHLLGYCISIGAVLILAVTLFAQAEITTTFTREYDDHIRILEIEKVKNSMGIVSIPAMPDHGMLYWEEFSTDTGYFTNQHIRKGLDLPFGVVVRE